MTRDAQTGSVAPTLIVSDNETKVTSRHSDLNRRGFGLKKEITPILDATYTSGLIAHIRKNGGTLQAGELTIRLAKEFGFCYGVDRAVLFAYETRKKFPDRNIFITAEIIHNPRVNKNLLDQGIRFLSGRYKGDSTLDDVKEGDVVLLPAFGATLEEIDMLREKKCVLVDTTCGSVMNVWRQVERNARDGFTSIIHGKKEHEETIATSSRAMSGDPSEGNHGLGGHYLVVRNEKETLEVCDYIRHGGDRNTFLQHFEGAYSKGFDPDRHLTRVGVANQTTMLANESLHISNLLEKAFRDRVESEHLSEYFRKFDTICTATQERQDAISEMGVNPPDLFIVIGGFNSSNTTHLAAMAQSFAPTYHIGDADCVISAREIRCKNPSNYEVSIQKDWLPEGPVQIGFTSGASTPDRAMADVICRIAELKDVANRLPVFESVSKLATIELPILS